MVSSGLFRVRRLPCASLLGFYDHQCANVCGVIKLARFPIRHPNASVGCGHSRQVTLVQSVSWGKLEKIGHRCAHEVRMRRFRVTPRIDVGLHDVARVINKVTIDTGPMIFVLTDNLKTTNRRAVSFTATRYPRRCSSLRSAIKIGFLRPQAHDDRRPAVPTPTMRQQAAIRSGRRIG